MWESSKSSDQGHKGQSEWKKGEGGGANLLEAWSTHGLHHCFFLVLAFVRSAPKNSTNRSMQHFIDKSLKTLYYLFFFKTLLFFRLKGRDYKVKIKSRNLPKGDECNLKSLDVLIRRSIN